METWLLHNDGWPNTAQSSRSRLLLQRLQGQPLLFNSYKELFRATCQLYYPDIINKIPFQSGLASCRPNRQMTDRKPGSYDRTAVLEADLGTSHCPGVGNPHHKQNGSFPQVLQPRCEQTLFGITLNSAPTLDSNSQMTKQNSGNKFPVLMEAIQQKRSFPGSVGKLAGAQPISGTPAAQRSLARSAWRWSCERPIGKLTLEASRNMCSHPRQAEGTRGFSKDQHDCNLGKLTPAS